MIATNKLVALRKDVPSGTVVLQRPECRNAINRAMIDLLIEAFEDFQQERSVRALILTGGGDIFSSGSDLKEIRETRDASDAMEIWYREANRLQELIELMLRFPKPIICAVNGPALGTGLALALASDLIVASENASFGMPECQLGLSTGMTAPLLAFRLGVANASRFLYTDKSVAANDARQLGLVHHLVSDNQLWVKAHELATECSNNAIQSIQLNKQMINETIGETLFTQLSIGAANMATARTTDFAAQGIDAFLEKKTIDWS